jgi:hypothetical protein
MAFQGDLLEMSDTRIFRSDTRIFCIQFTTLQIVIARSVRSPWWTRVEGSNKSEAGSSEKVPSSDLISWSPNACNSAVVSTSHLEISVSGTEAWRAGGVGMGGGWDDESGISMWALEMHSGSMEGRLYSLSHGRDEQSTFAFGEADLMLC